jgi:putative Mg2+ transporter-C (MgtC) family protein
VSGGRDSRLKVCYNDPMQNVINPVTLAIGTRLFVALILGMLIGVERMWAHKTAGMRTYALVSMGSALFVITSSEIVAAYANFSGLNPIMIIAQIVVGVGFLGTGVIFSRDSKLMGMTTASSLWVSAGIGMAAGFGLFSTALIATLLTLFIFTVLWFIEDRLKKSKFFQSGDIENNQQ